jgi:hypothetical protein
MQSKTTSPATVALEVTEGVVDVPVAVTAVPTGAL